MQNNKNKEEEKGTGTNLPSTTGTGSVVKRYGSWSSWKQEVKMPTVSDDTPRNKEFEKLCSMSQLNVKSHCGNGLKNMGYKPVYRRGFLFAKGELPILLVAHLDTVHFQEPKEFIYHKGEVHSPTGIGGDDRCGLYIILNIVKELKCSVVLLEEEESGCIGARAFTKSKEMQEILGEINYIVEFDRRGKTDAVFYECDNQEFEDFITENGKGYFQTDFGSCSDISVIAPAMGVAAVNLSSGYYSEHTAHEKVNLLHMEQTIVEAKKIIQKPCEEYFEYIEKKYGSWGKKLQWYDDWEDDLDDDYIYDYVTTPKKKNNPYGDLIIEDGEILIYSNNQNANKLYHIHYEDNVRSFFVAEILAASEVEAVGLFLAQFPTCNYKGILEIKKSLSL